MKCKNCNTEITENQKFCPECGAEIKPKKTLSKKAQAFIACVCCLALIISGTIGGLYFYNNANSMNSSDSNYIALESGFTDIKVTDEESALEAISTVADVIGIENVEKELKISSTNTVDSDTYYRFQQYYNDIPVYGSTIVISADKDGNATALVSNYKFCQFEYNYQSYIQDENKTVVYCVDHEAYICSYEYLNTENDELIVFYDIESGKPIDSISMIYTSADNDYVSTSGNEYFVFDEKRNIKPLNCNKKLLNNTFDDELNDDGSYKIIRNFYSGNNKDNVRDIEYDRFMNCDAEFHINNDISLVKADSVQNLDNNAIELTKSVQAVYDYYYKILHRKGFDDENSRMYIAYNDKKDKGINAYANCGSLLAFGYKQDLSQIDLVAHEYTHSVEKTISNMIYRGETGAIMEGYSDIMGELIQAYQNSDEPDWAHNPVITDRKMNDPLESKMPNYYEGKYWKTTVDKLDKNNQTKNDHGHVHNNSTVISHPAYLMWNGINGNNIKKIDEKSLAKLWYCSLFFLQSNATFSQCRNAVELSARIMSKNDELTQEQYNCVCEAFNAVGIENANYTYQSKVKNDFNLKVLSSKETDNVNFNLKIYKPSDTALIGFINSIKKPELALEENSLYGNKQINLDDGVYLLEITDLDDDNTNSKPITTKIIVDENSENASDEVIIYTDFSDITTVVLNGNKSNIILSSLLGKTLDEATEICGSDYEDIDYENNTMEYNLGGCGPMNGVVYDNDNFKGIFGLYKDNENFNPNEINYILTSNSKQCHAKIDDNFSTDNTYAQLLELGLNEAIIENESSVYYYTQYQNTEYIITYMWEEKPNKSDVADWVNISSIPKETSIDNSEITNDNTDSNDAGQFYGNQSAEQLRKSIIGSWGALGSIVPEYNFIDSEHCSGEYPWQLSGTYSISDNKMLTISWAGVSELEEYIWSSESWDEFYSHHEYGTDFWYMTDDGILMLNGKEKYRDGVDNFTYNSNGDLMSIISGTWISEKGYKEYQINSDGTWIESTVVVSGGTLINRTKLDNGKVEIIDDSTAKLWQEVEHLNQIPGASELIYDSKNDKISVGGTNNTFTRAKYK